MEFAWNNNLRRKMHSCWHLLQRLNTHKNMLIACENPENFVRGCPTLTAFFYFFFLDDEGWVDPSSTISHLNGISLVGRWWPNIECWLGSFVIFRGSGPVLLRNHIFLWFFMGSGPLCPTSGSAHVIAFNAYNIMGGYLSNRIIWFKINLAHSLVPLIVGLCPRL